MAASASSITVTSRHQGRLWLNLSSRCARLQFSGIPTDVEKVRLVWMQCYDPTSLHPEWKAVKDSTGEVELKGASTAEFVLLFGPNPPLPEDETLGVCKITLARPQDPIPAGQPILPTLAFALQTEDHRTLYSSRLKLHAFWNETVFDEAVDIFNKSLKYPTDEFLDTALVSDILATRWKNLFSYLRHESKSRGKKIVDHWCSDDDEDSESAIPRLTKEMIQRIILIGGESADLDLPPLISKRAFCGKSVTEGISIWRIFQTLIEMVGRSPFLRQLSNHGQLHMLGPQETVAIHTDKLAELGQPLVYFFRLPRSIVNEPALVIELFQAEDDGEKTKLKPIRPTPYITASQLERGNGNPFVAFAHLESAHAEILKALHPRGLLQPPNIQQKYLTEDAEEASGMSISPNIKDLSGRDKRWWSKFD